MTDDFVKIFFKISDDLGSLDVRKGHGKIQSFL